MKAFFWGGGSVPPTRLFRRGLNTPRPPLGRHAWAVSGDGGAGSNAGLDEGQAEGDDVVFDEGTGGVFAENDDVGARIEGTADGDGLGQAQDALKDFDGFGGKIADGRGARHGEGVQAHGVLVDGGSEGREIALKDGILGDVGGFLGLLKEGFPIGGFLASEHAFGAGDAFGGVGDLNDEHVEGPVIGGGDGGGEGVGAVGEGARMPARPSGGDASGGGAGTESCDGGEGVLVELELGGGGGGHGRGGTSGGGGGKAGGEGEVVVRLENATFCPAFASADVIEDALDASHGVRGDLPGVDDEGVMDVVVIPGRGGFGDEALNVKGDGVEKWKIQIGVALAPVFGHGDVCMGARGGAVGFAFGFVHFNEWCL